jgi:intracellular multiplication protein IcmL
MSNNADTPLTQPENAQRGLDSDLVMTKSESQVDSVGLDVLLQSDDQTVGSAATTLRENADLRVALAYERQRNFRLWGAVLVLVFLLSFVFLGVVAVFPKYRYIATIDNQAVCEVGTENNPRITPEVLTEYAKDATIDLYTYSFVDWRERINAAINKWMTDSGRIGFLSGLESTGNLERVRKGRLILKSMATAVPQLEEKGYDGITRFWVVRVPIALEFYSAQSDKPISTQHYLAAVKIVEVPPTARNVKGIAVEQLVLAHLIAR